MFKQLIANTNVRMLTPNDNADILIFNRLPCVLLITQNTVLCTHKVQLMLMEISRAIKKKKLNHHTNTFYGMQGSSRCSIYRQMQAQTIVKYHKNNATSNLP